MIFQLIFTKKKESLLVLNRLKKHYITSAHTHQPYTGSVTIATADKVKLRKSVK